MKIAEQARIYIGLWLISHVKQDAMDYVPYVRKIVGKGGFIRSLLSRFFRRALCATPRTTSRQPGRFVPVAQDAWRRALA